MRRAFALIVEWYRPRERHSFLELWWKSYVPIAIAMIAVNLISGDPVVGALVSPLWISLCYALGNYAYFHVYGGIDESYPDPAAAPSMPAAPGSEAARLAVREESQQPRLAESRDCGVTRGSGEPNAAFTECDRGTTLAP